LLVPVVVDALKLLVIVFNQRIQGTRARLAGLIDSCRRGLHSLHNRRELPMSEKTYGVKSRSGES
jgi:hypothetical protein